tara:strand:+ start:237 stop:752 length:516 start_codon:yes stop_codon:yes gene_type:complete
MVKTPAIFFDRDGILIKTKIINQNPVAIKSINEIVINRGIINICKKLNKNFYLFMITNQPDVSRGNNTKKNVNEINSFLKKKLKLKKTYVCFSSNNTCKDRKPNPGMIKKAIKTYSIDAKKSYMIGDRWKDIVAGQRSKCKTILLNKKYSEKNKCKPDYTIKNLKDILKIV